MRKYKSTIFFFDIYQIYLIWSFEFFAKNKTANNIMWIKYEGMIIDRTNSFSFYLKFQT